MLVCTLRALSATPAVDGIILVMHPDDISTARRLIRSYRIRKICRLVSGGKTRAHSVFGGLQAVPPGTEWVAIHDGARPLVTPKIVEDTLRAARRFKAAVAAGPGVPTVKQAKGEWVARTLNRNHLWAIQTPQIFQADLIRRAYARGIARGMPGTDDAAFVEAIGRRVRLVMGSHRNLKVTTPEDLVVAEAFLKNRSKG